MCVFLQGKYNPFHLPSLSGSYCAMFLSVLLVFPHHPKGTARTAVPMTTSVLLSITMAALFSLAHTPYIRLPWLWQVCRWLVIPVYRPHQQMHTTLQPLILTHSVYWAPLSSILSSACHFWSYPCHISTCCFVWLQVHHQKSISRTTVAHLLLMQV